MTDAIKRNQELCALVLGIGLTGYCKHDFAVVEDRDLPSYCWFSRCRKCGFEYSHRDELEEIEFEWCSTPALWAAYRHGYDGAPDAHHKIGFGKTKEEAAADLIEQEAE